jgi:hypothetical protein
MLLLCGKGIFLFTFEKHTKINNFEKEHIITINDFEL